MKNSKNLYVILTIVAIAVLAFWWWSVWSVRRTNVEAPLETNDINRDLEGLNVDNLDTEFEQIDQDLNSL